MAETSVAAIFRAKLPSALDRLTQDEWAVTTLRDSLAVAATQEDAFACVPEAIRLACVQDDSYAFLSCCWFALDLARRSQTTEAPYELQTLLRAAKLRAVEFNCESEVPNVAAWYRRAI
jgi:hypothetical protein